MNKDKKPSEITGTSKEQAAKELFPNISMNGCTGPIDFDKKNCKQKELRKAFLAGVEWKENQHTEEVRNLKDVIITLQQGFAHQNK